MAAKTKKAKDAAVAANAETRNVVISQQVQRRLAFELYGTTALIQNNFSQKAIEELLAKHMGIARERERKKPRELLEQATIRNVKSEICMKPVAFKSGMCSAADGLKNLKMAQIKRRLYVEGESIPITYDERVDRMDMVRVGGKAPDVRFRPSFYGWKCRLIIVFSDSMSIDTVVDLLNRAGPLGIGEWRMERNGSFGKFRIARQIVDEKEIAEVMQACSVPMPAWKIPEWAIDAELDPEVLQKLLGQAGAETGATPDEVEEVGEAIQSAKVAGRRRA